MAFGAEHWWHVGGLFVLFVVAAFFSAAETALMSIDRLRVRYLVEKGQPGALQLQSLLSHPEKLLSAILLGNNLANIAASVFTTALFFSLFGPRGELLIVLVLTPVLVIFTEAWPKTYAARYPEKMCFILLHPMRLIMWLLRPLTWALAGISSLLNRCLRGEEERPLISEDELRSFIEFGEHAGVVGKRTRKMLHGVFDLGEIRVRDVMVPRPEVVGIEAGTAFAGVLKIVAETRHSRFPVFDGDLDRVVGVIHTKEILDCIDSPEEFSLRRMARPPLFVPESKPIEELLQTFRRRHLHLALVVDEYGSVAGIVTLEDVFEVIVGEIQDEYDDEEALIRPVAPNRFLVDGSISLRVVNHRFDLALSEEHVNTLAGFVLHELGSIPAEGQSFEANGVRFTVRRMEDRRIDKIEVELPGGGLIPPG